MKCPNGASKQQAVHDALVQATAGRYIGGCSSKGVSTRDRDSGSKVMSGMPLHVHFGAKCNAIHTAHSSKSCKGNPQKQASTRERRPCIYVRTMHYRPRDRERLTIIIALCEWVSDPYRYTASVPKKKDVMACMTVTFF
jgi:hypothetical protein